MEMVKEMRDVKNTMTESMGLIKKSMEQMTLSNMQSVKELKKLNKHLNKEGGEESDGLDEEILKCPYSGQIIGKKLKEKIDKDIEKDEAETVIDVKNDSPRIEDVKSETFVTSQHAEPVEAPKEPELPDFPDLTEDQRTALTDQLTKFKEAFKVESEKDTALKQLKLVFTMIKN